MQFDKIDDDYLMYDGGDDAAATDGAAAKGKAMFDHKNTDPACCDDADHCCKCIPLELGIKLLAVWTIISTILMIIDGCDIIGKEVIWGIITLCMCIFPAYTSFKFF